MGTYSGKILYVDLSSGRVRKEPISESDAKKYIGGLGPVVRLAYDLIEPGIDALSPENPIIIGTGLLTGTLAPGTPKSFIMSKCASTGTINHGVGSGVFGPMLKWAGYDCVVVTGKSEKPVYIMIDSDDVTVCSADGIWGRDTFDATDALKERHGEDFSVLCIGPAGENLVKLSIPLIDKVTTLGRTMGANFGSKNLKAILVRGEKGVAVSNRGEFMRVANSLIAKGMADPNRDNWRNLALFFVLPNWLRMGHRSYRHAMETLPEEMVLQVYGPEQYLKIKKCSVSCPTCLACDKAVVEIKEGEFAGLTAPVSTPSNLAYGSVYGLKSLSQSIKLCDLLNRYGIDWVLFRGMYDWLVELYENGVVTKGDLGFEPKMGDFDLLVKVIDMIARREGFGEVLAQGWLGAIKTIGKGSEAYAYQVKGINPDFDARVTLGVESFGLVTNPRPAYDMPVGGLTLPPGRKLEFFTKLASQMGFPKEAMERVFDSHGFNLGRYNAHYENWATVLNLMGICFRLQVSRLYDIQGCAELFSSVTGIPMTPDELIQAAERVWNLHKMANVREGFDRRHDAFPRKWFTPLNHQGKQLVMKDYFSGAPITEAALQKLLDDYYSERGWDVRSGIPSPEKLSELGLSDIRLNLRDSNSN